jgi:hypothetical protein
MLLRGMTTLSFAAACLTAAAAVPAAHAQTYGTPNQVLTNGPQSSGVEQSGGWSAQQNVKESQQYHHLLQTNRRFREARMRKECGPIVDPVLHQQCLQSFAEYSPYGVTTPAYAGYTGNYGSSAGPNYGSAAGGTDNGNPGTTVPAPADTGTAAPGNAGGWNTPGGTTR